MSATLDCLAACKTSAVWWARFMEVASSGFLPITRRSANPNRFSEVRCEVSARRVAGMDIDAGSADDVSAAADVCGCGPPTAVLLVKSRLDGYGYADRYAEVGLHRYQEWPGEDVVQE